MENVSIAPYLDVIKQKYPKIKRRQIVVRDYGWDNLVFIVNKSIVFRFPRDERSALGLRSQVEFAARFQRFASLPIPHPQQERTRGKVYVTYPLVHGEPLKPVWLQRCTLTNQRRMAQQLGHFLTILHAFSVRDALSVGVKRKQFGRTSYDSIVHFRTHLRPHIPSKEWHWVVARLARIQLLIRQSNFRSVVTHNDVAPSHVLFDPARSRLTGIIDFGDVAISDPAVDFFRLSVFPASFVQHVRAAYGGKIDMLFFERENAYRDLTIMHRLVHYIQKGDPVLSRSLGKALRRRTQDS